MITAQAGNRLDGLRYRQLKLKTKAVTMRLNWSVIVKVLICEGYLLYNNNYYDDDVGMMCDVWSTLDVWERYAGSDPEPSLRIHHSCVRCNRRLPG